MPSNMFIQKLRFTTLIYDVFSHKVMEEREKSGRFRRETDRFYELRMFTHNVHIYGRFSSISLCKSFKIERHRRRFRIFQSKFGEYRMLKRRHDEDFSMFRAELSHTYTYHSII